MPHVNIKIIDGFVITSTLFSAFVLIKYIYLQHIRTLEFDNVYRYNCMTTIFENINLTIFLEDNDGNILTANSGQLDLIGLTPDDVIGKNTKDIFDLPEEYLQKKEEAIRTKKTVKHELKFTIKNNSSHWVRIAIFPVLNIYNEVDKVIIIFLNIDKEHKIAEIKEDFIATLTHDLKTPTLAQLKTLDLLLNNTFGELTQEQAEIIKHIKNSCTYLNDLIFTILDSYMYENGNKSLIYDKINIPLFLKDALLETEYLSQGKNQSIVVTSNLIHDDVCADRLQLKRVLINLITNAINHGLPNTTVTISITSDYNDFKFEIRNQGTYIDDTKIAEIFHKFKTNTNDKYKKIGNGLGLYLSKTIIEKHNGNIYAKSYTDGLCIFGFEIPTNPQNTKEKETEKIL